MRSQLALLFLFCLTALAPAQSVKLDFGSKGQREVWAESAMPLDTPVGTQSFDSNTGTVNLGGAQPADILFVWDKASGNVAYKRIKDVGGEWKLSAADYKLIGLVKVRVEHKGKPAASAAVILGDGQTNQQELLDASAKGVAEFFGIKPGQAKVEVAYRSGGKDMAPLKQSFELSLKRSTPDPVLIVSIPEEVETLSEFGPEGEEPKKPANSNTAPNQNAGGTGPDSNTESKPGNNILANILTFIIVLGIALAILYFGLRWLKSNPDTAEDTLNKLGVQVPKQQGADPAAPPAPINVTPLPPQQIVLDDAAPNILGTAAVAPIATQSMGGQSRLVGESGRVIDLQEGQMAVGREDGLPISLSGESSVSRRHAEVVKNGSQVLVRDLGSTNGTFVNGRKLNGEQTLKPGDTVQFGAVKFRYEG